MINIRFNSCFASLSILLALTSSGFGQTAPATGRRTLYGHVPPVVSSLIPIERLAGTNRLRLAIGLPLRDRAGLTNLLHDLYDPASPRYRQYLTVEQFTERHGPVPADYATLTAFAQTNGLTVRRTHANRLLLDVEGSVTDIERTFGVQMETYQHPHENRRFFAPDREPSVPVGVPVLDIEGLNNYQLPHHAEISMKKIPVKYTAHVKGGASTAGGGGNTSAAWTGSGIYGAFTPADIRAAYAPGVTLIGAGQTVGIVSFDGFYPNDILNYEQQINLPNVPVIPVLIDGAEGKVGASGSSFDGNDSETSLDIEMAIAMAPGLSQVLVYEAVGAVNSGSLGFNLANDILNRIATDNIAKQISTSWIWYGGSSAAAYSYYSSTDQIFQQMAAQGQSFFCASGDWGANMVSPSLSPDPFHHYDAGLMTSPYITLVGGTTLTTASAGGPWQSETTWHVPSGSTNETPGDSSGGDISASYAIPGWQQGIDMSANGGSTTMRNTPDVAMLADGVLVAFGNGLASSAYGTSAAAPLWAGFTALINQQAAAYGQPPVGFLNPAIYAIGNGTNYAACFHDITTGNNTNSVSPTNFFAVPGYDLCTGWGTPTGQPLINALATPDLMGIIPASGFTAANGPVGPFNITSQTFTLTNGGGSPLNWSLGNTCAWLNVSASGGTLLPGGPAATFTVSLNANADALATGNYVATLLFTNLATGYVQMRNFNLIARQPLVQNGGFENGYQDASDNLYLSFSPGWSVLGGLLSDSYVFWGYPHSGTHSAFLAILDDYEYAPNPFLPGRLRQIIPTVPGQTYLLSFWIKQWAVSEYIISPAVGAFWDGSMVFELSTNSGAWTNYINITRTVTATSAATPLEFALTLGSYDLTIPGIEYTVYLDDVSVTLLSNVPPAIAVPPTMAAVPLNSPASFAVSVTGNWPLVYQWQRNGVILSDGFNIQGSTSNQLVIASSGYGDMGNYSVVISNAWGAVTSAPVSLTVLGTNLLLNGSFETPAAATDTVTNTIPIGWSSKVEIINGNPYPGNGYLNTTPGYDPLPGFSSGPVPEDGQQCVDIAGTSLSQSFTVTNAWTYWFSWFDNTPIPAAELWNNPATPLNPYAAYSYALRNGANNIITNTSIAITNFATFQGIVWQQRAVTAALTPGFYTITFQDLGAGVDSLLDNVQVRPVLTAPAIIPPTFTSQPQSLTNLAGTIASFSASATGSAPLSYQWQFNGTNLTDNLRISGSLTTNLTVNSLLAGDAGAYQVIMTNSSGSVTSSVATLTVVLPPQFQALSQTGGIFSFAWNASPGQMYQVQVSSDLTQTNWINLGSPITASGSTVNATDSMTNSQRFYRVLLLP